MLVPCLSCRSFGVRHWMAGENQNELRKVVHFAFDPETARMLMHDRVVAQRQAESGSLARGLGGEEGIEDLVDDVLGNSGAVVHTWISTLSPQSRELTRRIGA